MDPSRFSPPPLLLGSCLLLPFPPPLLLLSGIRPGCVKPPFPCCLGGRNPSALLGVLAAKYRRDGASGSPLDQYHKSPSQLFEEGLLALSPELAFRVQRLASGSTPGLRLAE